MIFRSLAAIAAICAAVAVSVPEPVLADGMSAARPAARQVVKVRHHYRVTGYRYVRGPWPGGPDPYAYAYLRTKYYPYYGSAHWVPRRQMIGRSRYPLRIPVYGSSWGYPLGCKVSGYRHCGVPYRKPHGDPRHYYRRDVQLPKLRRHY